MPAYKHNFCALVIREAETVSILHDAEWGSAQTS